MNKEELYNNIDINDDNNDDEGRIKGSIKDRVINFFYRKRYKIKLNRSLLYSNDIVSKNIFRYAPRLNKTRIKKINTINDLRNYNGRVIAVDPKNENFDFEKYDYYIIRNVRKKGIGPENQYKDMKQKSGLSKISVFSVLGLKGRIEESKKIINDTQKEVENVKLNLQYPVMHREDMVKMYNKIRENINDLKYEYELLKGETNNRSYALEEAINVMDKIDKYDPKGIETLETMLKVGLHELDVLSLNVNVKKEKEEKNIEIKEKDKLNLYQKPIGIDVENKDKKEEKKLVDEIVKKDTKEEIENRQNEFEFINVDVLNKKVGISENLEEEYKIDNDFISESQIKDNKENEIDNQEEKELKNVLDEEIATIKVPKNENINYNQLNNMKVELVKINSYEQKIAYELKRQKEILDAMYKDVGKYTKNEYKTYEIKGYGRIFSSFGNIAMGMLTLPLSNVNLFNLTLGTALINRGLDKMKKGLETKEKINIEYKYEDFSRILSNQEQNINNAELLLDNSLSKLVNVREQFVKEFSKYDYQIPDYKRTIEKINQLEKKLKNSQMSLNKIEKNIVENKEKNKVMLKKIETEKRNN